MQQLLPLCSLQHLSPHYPTPTTSPTFMFQLSPDIPAPLLDVAPMTPAQWVLRFQKGGGGQRCADGGLWVAGWG
jgi:hypothetical protein